MEALGSVSQIYMFILLALLFVGSGLAIWSFLNFLADKAIGKPTSAKKKQVILNNGPNQEPGSVKKTYGGFIMVNNGWIKLAVFSFVGIIASVIILGFVSTTNPMNTASNAHLQHQQQGMSQSGYSQGTMDPNMQMQGNVNGNMGSQMQGNMNGNMGAQMQGNMNGNMGYQVQGNMNGNMGQQNDYMMMQQQIYQMQMQMNQIQQQLGMSAGNMSGNMQSQSGGMSSMPQSSGGMGMGMMPMMSMGGSMSSMPQSNSSMSSMPQGNTSMPQSSSGSGGGMGMM